MAAVFRFRRCPIFVTEILDVQGDEVVFSKLCCWTKGTILVPSPRPCQIHPDAPDPAEFLPPTERIVWMWQKKKCHMSRRALVRAGGDAQDRSAVRALHTLGKASCRGDSRCLWMPSKSVLGRNNETVHQGVAGKGQEGPQ